MRLPKHFFSFRARLLLVLALLLIATLGVQYTLNRRAGRRIGAENRLAEANFNNAITEQERALAAGFALAVKSLSSRAYLEDLQKEANNPLLTKEARRVENILVVNEDGRIDDSLDPKYKPETLPNGTYHYFNISEIPLPKLVAADPSLDEIRQMLPSSAITSQPPRTGEPRAFPFRVNTDKGTNYIFIVLGSANPPNRVTPSQAARPLWPTLVVMLIAILSTGILVWRFTRPLNDLSEAARRVAAGDFDFRVPAADRRDEMGALAATFNEMIMRLGHARELESRVNQMERSAVIGRLASAIAHEIRNPLNYINLTLDHLRTSLAPEDAAKREKVGRLTDNLKTEVQRINKRISEFLSYTRPSELNLRPLDLHAAVVDALSLVEVQASESGIETRVEQQTPLPVVEGDADSLRSVFTNLIINGLQAIEGNGEGGRLTITLSAADGHARVAVADTGKGIAPEHLPQIFEPYFSTKDTGTGLGLAIVKKAIEDHGGAIFVESKPDEGTTFIIELPTTRNGDS
ncbi:MAG TPA: ATP-binding protein [Pyrinomonadaceae bacterium]|jgi:signal transduction histidine kinase